MDRWENFCHGNQQILQTGSSGVFTESWLLTFTSMPLTRLINGIGQSASGWMYSYFIRILIVFECFIHVHISSYRVCSFSPRQSFYFSSSFPGLLFGMQYAHLLLLECLSFALDWFQLLNSYKGFQTFQCWVIGLSRWTPGSLQLWPSVPWYRERKQKAPTLVRGLKTLANWLIHSAQAYTSSIYYMPYPLLGTGNTEVEKRQKLLPYGA